MTGISSTNSGKYRARVYKNGKQYHVGTFNTLTEAMEKREAFIKSL